MTNPNPNAKAVAFLKSIDDNPPIGAPLKPNAEPKPAPAPRAARPAKAPPASRVGLKHIGGYFDREDVEKIAILRARLGLDNSQLIRLAVEELFKKHSARRAFGDDR
jgi:hypothetical protein